MSYLQSENVTGFLRDLTFAKFGNDSSIILGIRDDGDTAVVLSSSAQKSNTTNINLFNGLRNSDTLLSNSLLKGIQVADDNVNLLDLLLGKILLIAFDIASENACNSKFVNSISLNLFTLLLTSPDLHEQQGAKSLHVHQAFREPW